MIEQSNIGQDVTLKNKSKINGGGQAPNYFFIYLIFFTKKRFHKRDMKGEILMARDPKTPVTFVLPDNDSVALIPWAYVVAKFDEILKAPLDDIELINKDLERIDTKLGTWLENN